MTYYWGWVPNKTGAISFTQIGTQCGQKLLFEDTSETARGCNVVSIQNRTLKLDDSLFDIRTRFQNSLLGKEDTFFMLSAECRRRRTSSDCLTGKISCRFGKADWRDIEQFVEDTELVFEVTFRLKRNGMCGFRNVSISDDDIIYVGGREFLEEYLVSQAYMFLRDMVHRHKHHDPKSDTFLDIKTASENRSPISAIKNQITYSLGKMVITQPLKYEPETIQNSLGILAYLSSFQNSVDVHTYKKEHLSSIKDSLNAEYSRINLQLTGIRWACGVFLGLYYFLSKIEPLNFGSLDKWTYWNAIYLAVLVAVILYMGQITKVIDIRKIKLSMELTRVFPYFRLFTATAIAFSLAALSFAVMKILGS